jgi:signal transduction histidine kinase
VKLLPSSLRGQITLGIAAFVMLVVALAGAAITLRIEHSDRADVDRQLAVRADKVPGDAAKLVADSHPDGDAAAADYGGLLSGSETLVRVLSGGQVLAERGDRLAQPVPVPTANGLSTVTVDGQAWRSLVKPVAGTTWRLQVLQSLEPVERRMAATGSTAALVALAAALLAAAGSWLVTGFVFRPLDRLRVGARHILPGDYDWRLPAVRRPQEVAELSATLNGMVERLQASTLATRRFTADAAHELRTPLSSLGMDLETLRRNPDLPADLRHQTLADMEIEHHRIVSLLDGLLALARGDAGVLPARSAVDVGDLVSGAVTRARGRHSAITYVFTEPADDRITVDGWQAGLLLAVENLLDNAALHGRQDGTVEVAVDRDGTLARICVADDGPGVPAAAREKLKQRFARGPRPRHAGSGLGLALVEQQAILHGGALDLGPSRFGGLQAILVFPRVKQRES